MLLGCCHCGETPSESTPPSESLPPSESSEVPSESDVSIMGERWDCSACTILPVRWRVTGIERSQYTFSSASGLSSPWTDCPGMFEPLDLVFDVQYPRPGTPTATTQCQTWVSTQKVINSTRDKCVPGPCAPWPSSCQEATFVGGTKQPRATLLLQRGNMITRKPRWTLTWSYAFQVQDNAAVLRTLIFTQIDQAVGADGNCVTALVMFGGADSTLNNAYLSPGYSITLTPS